MFVINKLDEWYYNDIPEDIVYPFAAGYAPYPLQTVPMILQNAYNLLSYKLLDCENGIGKVQHCEPIRHQCIEVDSYPAKFPWLLRQRYLRLSKFGGNVFYYPVM